MKKILLVLTVLIFSLTAFTSCEKEEDVQSISEFVIGEWVSESTLELTITNDRCRIEKEDETFGMMGYFDAGYTINKAMNKIILGSPDNPTMESNIVWLEGGNTMTWTQLEIKLTTIPEIIEWTRKN